MGQKKDLYNSMMAMIRQMQAQQTPKNEPQDLLTQQAIQGHNWLKGRDYRDLSKAGTFFNFQAPAEQNEARQRLVNASGTGTFGLADNAGQTQQLATQKNYLADRFARDSAVNFQNNISGAANNVQSGLAQSSDATARSNAQELNKQQAILNAMQNVYQTRVNAPNIWGSVLGAASGVASAAIGKA